MDTLLSLSVWLSGCGECGALGRRVRVLRRWAAGGTQGRLPAIRRAGLLCRVAGSGDVMVVVRFESTGPLGISWRNRQEDGAAIVKTIRPGG